MTKAWKIAILILCAAALCLSALSLVVACKSGQEQGDVQYVLYLGTNDKDSNQPVFSHEQAKQTLTDILVRRFGGYTVQEANGGWIDGGNPRCELEVDGGVNAQTGKICVENGANVLVTGSAWFKNPDPAAFCRALKS